MDAIPCIPLFAIHLWCCHAFLRRHQFCLDELYCMVLRWLGRTTKYRSGLYQSNSNPCSEIRIVTPIPTVPFRIHYTTVPLIMGEQMVVAVFGACTLDIVVAMTPWMILQVVMVLLHIGTFANTG